MRVIVIGAGLGGLTLAHGLRQEGIDVVVYERDGPDGRPQGISLHFDDRGTAALRACLPPEHVAMVEATMGEHSDCVHLMSAADGGFELAGTKALDGKAPRPRPGRHVNRPVLRAVLLTGLGDAVRFGATFERFAQRADGSVDVRFADGSSDRADVLVGADGIGSAVRRQYLPRVRVRDTGIRMLMGATPLRALDDPAVQLLFEHSPTAVRVGGRMLMAVNAMRYAQRPPAARDRLLPSLRSPAVEEAEDYLMWAMPTSKVGAAESPAGVWRIAQARAASAPATVRPIVDRAWPDLTVPLRVGVIPPMRPWPSSAVTVIGDAVHVAPGIGGNLAMRDAHHLRDALVRAARGEQDLPAAIGDYEDTMRSSNFPAPFTLARLQMRLLPVVAPIARRRLG